MTYGERLGKAMEYAKLNQPDLAKQVRGMMLAAGINRPVGQQTVSKALSSSRSAYTSWFASACGVSAEWFENGIGDMEVKRKDSHSDWPFDFEQSRFLRLSPARKTVIEKTVLAMIEGFEAEMPTPKKTSKKRK